MRARESCTASNSVVRHRSRKKYPQRKSQRHIERLEDRTLLTAAPAGTTDPWASLLSHGPGCNCPICTGKGLDQIPVIQTGPTDPSQANPLSSLTQLHSNAGAAVKLFLDFNGHFEASWGGYSNVTTPVFDQDGDASTFSDGELTTIYQIWSRVAEDYAPFNIDVTTVDPGNETDGLTAVIAVGGSSADWYNGTAGGVAYVGGFSNGSPNVGYAFENNLGNGDPKYTGEAAAHEAGHLFGLQHQSTWNGSTLVETYSTGNGSWAPIMGVGYYAPRTTWYNGPTPSGPSVLQDDLAILSGSPNNFGYRADDFGSTRAAASALPTSGTSVNFSGLIGRYDDQDVWSFTTSGGAVSFQLTGAQYGSDLDAVLELQNSGGGVIVTDSPSGSQGASISTTVGAGTYYLVARSLGDYGDMGQYSITGSVPAVGSAPEIDLSVGGVSVADGGTIPFGAVNQGAAVTKTVTVTNQGNATLTLTSLNAASMPAGFTLLTNLGSTSLAAGQSTTFSVRLDATAVGSFSGTIQLVSNDGDENPYDLNLTGSVIAPEIDLSVGGAGVADGGTIDFGTTTQGTAVTKTVTVTNQGTATLTLTSLNTASMPAGFTLVTNLGSTSLAAGQSTTFSVRLDASTVGTYSGTVQLANNDSDENPYDLTFTGTVQGPEIDLTVGGAAVADGGTIAFGTTTLGTAVTKTVTVTNLGSSTLTLTSLTPASMPAGFTLVTNLGSTSLAAGQSTTFVVRLDATSGGTSSGIIQLANNDSNENPYDLTLTGTVTAPEIDVSVGGAGVADGGTIAFGTANQGAAVTKTVTVTNQGTSTLTLTSLNAGSMPTGFTLLTNLGSTSLAAGQSTTFSVRLDATAVGSFSGTIQLANNDGDENPYDLTLTGTVVAPEIDMSVGGTGLADGGTIAFGTTTQGTAVTQTVTVTNQGTATLSLTSLNAASLPAGFTLVTNLGSASLAAGQSTTFSVRLNAVAAGTYSGTVQLANNDSDENPYDLTLTGIVQAPEIDLAVGGAGVADGGTIAFGTTAQGTAVTKTVTITNQGSSTLSLTSLTPASLPAGFTLVTNLGSTSLAAGQSTTFVVGLDAVLGGTFSGTIQLANNDSDENPYDLTLMGTVQAPEIAVLQGATNLTDGQTYSFGATSLGASVTRVFTVTNQGSAALTLTSLNAASLPAGFTLVTNLGSTSLAAGQSTTFSIRLDSTVAGSFSGAITLGSNDSDENPFDLTLSGTVASPEIGVSVGGVAVADGGTIDFGTTPPGTAVTKTVTVTNQGSASLTLTSLNAASMPAGFTLVTNLGSNSLAAGQSTTFSIRLDATANGSFSGTIQLANSDSDENPYDLNLTGVVSTPPEISLSVGGVAVADGGTIAFGTTPPGTAVTKTITVTNQGSTTLSLTSFNAASLPTGFTLVTNIGSTSLAAGQSTTFSIRLDATAIGSFSGTIQLANNDADENPYDLMLTGIVSAPEIAIDIGGSGLTDGQTVNFDTVQGQNLTRVFTVTNQGNSTLTLTPLTQANMPLDFTLVTNLGSTSLAAGQSTTFSIRLDGTVAGSFSGTIHLANNDSDENPFDLTLQGNVAATVAGGEITVLVAGQNLALNGSVDFGSTVIGTTLERTFTVRNDGNSALTLSPLNPATLPAGFSVLQNLGNTSLAAGQSTTFILRLSGQTSGSFGGQISLANNDADEGPFTFNVTGSVAAPATPLTQIVDNGDAGSTLTGAWTRTTGKGYAGDFHSANKGLGYITATWSFNSLPQGQYRVYATWTTATSNATNSPFTLLDGGAALQTVAVNQRIPPSGLTIDGANWKLLGTATVNSGQLVVKLTNAANNRVVADAIRVERVVTTAAVPDIGIASGGVELTSGSGAVSFGLANQGSPQAINFQVTNHGTASLTLSPIDPASLPAGFSLVQNLGSTFLTPGESTTFAVRLDAAAVGSFGGTISVVSNDSGESPFTITVAGTVVDPNAPLVKIIDDVSAGNTLAGSWTHVTNRGYQGDIWNANAGAGAISSTWNFTNLPAGNYRVYATWRIASNNASNAPYTLYNGAQAVSTVRVNQRVAPASLWDGSTLWGSLGTVSVTGGQLQVKLTNAANNQVVADAIRIERVVPSGAAALWMTATSPDSQPEVGSAAAAWLSVLFASQQHAAPSDPQSSAPAKSPTGANSSAASHDAWLTLASAQEPEDRLLADALDLIGEARSALSPESASDQLSARDAALTALLETLV